MIQNFATPIDTTNPRGALLLHPFTNNGQTRFRGRLDAAASKTYGWGPFYHFDGQAEYQGWYGYWYSGYTYGYWYGQEHLSPLEGPANEVIPSRLPNGPYSKEIYSLKPFKDKNGRFRMSATDPYGRVLVGIPATNKDKKLKAIVQPYRSYEWMNYFNLKYHIKISYYGAGQLNFPYGFQPSFDIPGESNTRVIPLHNFDWFHWGSDLSYIWPGYTATTITYKLPKEIDIVLSNENVSTFDGHENIKPKYWYPRWQIPISQTSYSIIEAEYPNLPYYNQPYINPTTILSNRQGTATWYLVMGGSPTDLVINGSTIGTYGYWRGYENGLVLIDDTTKQVIGPGLPFTPIWLHPAYMAHSAALLGEYGTYYINKQHYQPLMVHGPYTNVGVWTDAHSAFYELAYGYAGVPVEVKMTGVSLEIEPWTGKYLF